VAARAATQAQKAMRQDRALEIRPERVFDELGHTRSGVCFGPGEKRLQRFGDHLIERRFLRSVPLVGEPRGCLRGLQCRRHDARSSTPIRATSVLNRSIT